MAHAPEQIAADPGAAGWVARAAVTVSVRARISPEIAASLAGFGFTYVGEQRDEEDVTELLFERPAGDEDV